MSDKEGLLRLDNHDTFSSLLNRKCISISHFDFVPRVQIAPKLSNWLCLLMAVPEQVACKDQRGWKWTKGGETHQLSIKTRIIGLDDKVFLARDMQSFGLHLLGHRSVFVGADHLLQFLRCDVEVWGRRPHGRAFGVEDGGLVDVAGADEAGGAQWNVSC